MDANALPEVTFQGLGDVSRIDRPVVVCQTFPIKRGLEIKVAMLFDTITGQLPPTAGRQAGDACKERVVGTSSGKKCAIQGRFVDLLHHSGMRENGFDLGGEEKFLAGLGYIKRLDAETVAGQPQGSGTEITIRKGEHPVEKGNSSLRSPGMEGGQEDFRVGCSDK